MSEEDLQRIYGDNWREIIAEQKSKQAAREAWLKRLIETGQDMPPQWSEFPDIHPYSIGWRMGGGESYRYEYHDWWQAVGAKWSEAERIAYFKRWPASPCWTLAIARYVFGISYQDSDSQDKQRSAIDRLRQHDFPSYEAYEDDLNDEKWRA